MDDDEIIDESVNPSGSETQALSELPALLPPDEVEGLPEVLRSAYVPSEDPTLSDMMVLRVRKVGDFELRNTKSVVSALEDERTRVRQLQKTQVPKDFDMAAARKALEENEELQRQLAEATDDEKFKMRLESSTRTLSDTHNAEMDAKEDDLTEAKAEQKSLHDEIERLLVDGTIATSVSTLPKLKGASPKVLRAILRDEGMVQVVRDPSTKKFEAKIVDPTKPESYRITMDGGKAREMAIPDLLTEMHGSSEYAGLFPSSVRPGAGSRSGSSGDLDLNGADNPWDPRTDNITEQMRIAKEDPARARKMALMHGVQLKT